MNKQNSNVQWGYIFLGVAVAGVVGYALTGNFAKALTYGLWLSLFAVGYAVRWGVLKLWTQYKTPGLVNAVPQVASLEPQPLDIRTAPKVNMTILKAVAGVIAGVVIVYALMPTRVDKSLLEAHLAAQARYYEASDTSRVALATWQEALRVPFVNGINLGAPEYIATINAMDAYVVASKSRTEAEAKLLEIERVMTETYPDDPTVKNALAIAAAGRDF